MIDYRLFITPLFFFAIIATMIHIYQHLPHQRDKQLGHIDPSNGRVYGQRLGPDKYIGRVDYEEGKVYASRLGPDEYLGRVDKHGHIYAHQLGPDRYVARIESDGKLYRHIPHGRDTYLGSLENMRHPVEGAAAFFFFFKEAAESPQDDNKSASQ